MTAIQAWQHIYSNVEQEQSPQGRGGFQTLFYTLSALTEEEVEEMEGRLLYFTSDIEPVKRVFFSLSTGKRVIAQLVPLTDPDQFGRKGRYLAHSLVFSAETFTAWGENPFPFFDQAPFITTVADALAQGNFQTGDIPPLTLPAPPKEERTIKMAQTWAKPELKKLTLLGLRNPQMAQVRRAAAFNGPPEIIEEALQAAFFALPTPLRPGCTFDTYFHRCNLVATYYWAVGFPQRTSNPTFDRVDAQAREVKQIADDQPQTAYERWATRMIDANDLATLAAQRDVAYSICLWLDGGGNDESLLSGASEVIIASVFSPNGDQVRELLRQKIGRHLSPLLAERALGQIYDASAPLTNYANLRAGFHLPQLLDELYQGYEAQGFSAPTRDEIKDLGIVLTAAIDHPLYPLQVAWEGKRKELQQCMRQLDPASYSQFLQTVLRFNLAHPLQMLVENKGELFLDIYLSDTAGPRQHIIPLEDLVEQLLDSKAANLLDHLVDLLPTQTDKTLREIEKLVKKRTDLPPTFQTALDDQLAKLPEKMDLKWLAKKISTPIGGLFRRNK